MRLPQTQFRPAEAVAGDQAKRGAGGGKRCRRRSVSKPSAQDDRDESCRRSVHLAPHGSPRPPRGGAFALATIVVALALAGCARENGAPRECGVRGIDISRHQGVIDWRAVKAAGVKFVWMKATEGGDYLDPSFRRNWVLARTAGLRRGAYHFAYWCRPGSDQAKWFVSNVPDDRDALPPVLDVEWNPGSQTCPRKVPRAEALASMKAILDLMERTYGKRPIIYAPADLYRDVLRGAFTDYPLWARSIGGDPATIYDDRDWLIWQYSETGTLAGIKGDVDLDCFADGDLGRRAWASAERD